MKPYRSILKAKLKETGMTQRQIAQAMGWSGNAAVSLVLSGGRDFGDGELGRMCEIAGVSIVWLAANSDDLLITAHKSSADLAAIAEQLTEDNRELLLVLAKQMIKP
jgi:transcriptional regulator with XRE-family HTH domain